MRPQEELHAAVVEVQTALHDDGFYSGVIDGWWGKGSRSSLSAMREMAARSRSGIMTAPSTQEASRIFTEADYEAAAVRIRQASGTARPLNEIVAAIKAFKEVESGDGWFTDVARINALDGPGGWIDGTALPKILFEAHKFGKHTGYQYSAGYPNLSSRSWNRSLYVGGPGEWERLWKAIKLDREAALKSASVGTFQILGENYAQCDFRSVEGFWDAHMYGGAAAHMAAFVAFIINGKLAAKLAKIDGWHVNSQAIAYAYNGPSYAENKYDHRIAKAYTKHLG